MSKPITISKLQVAAIFNVDERTISRWMKLDDPLPCELISKTKSGNIYNPHAVYLWGVRREVNKLITNDDGEVIDLDKEKARLTKAQADGQELKNGILSRSTAPVELLEWALGEISQGVRSILESVPLKIKKRMPELKAKEVNLIKSEISKAQNACSGVRLDFDRYENQ